MADAPSQLFFEDVEVGTVVPPLSVTVDPLQMFLFSAATYNGHRIHYDRSWAVDKEGYSDIVVQGPLQAALLARAVTDWIGGAGTLVSYAVQNRASAFPGEELVFTGTVTGLGESSGGRGVVELSIQGLRGDEVLMPGTATVSLPLRAGTGS
ncbi:MaoC/PaaZ C-terminal domain-containing protein [Rhodococcus sp. X156]|uniref:MaoC/PaaZ C-terminal domain-containing protein n=1 Tax=Rhodococcus sp. X156 TaxID=2499145 RepID=UPI000FD73E52|nr:MaoC/PaaZ C-terminal domain-containing protein [Rhodococcus sp. X156]